MMGMLIQPNNEGGAGRLGGLGRKAEGEAGGGGGEQEEGEGGKRGEDRAKASGDRDLVVRKQSKDPKDTTNGVNLSSSSSSSSPHALQFTEEQLKDPEAFIKLLPPVECVPLDDKVCLTEENRWWYV